jgi:hypothetical protein
MVAGCLTEGTNLGVLIANDVTKNDYFSLPRSDSSPTKDEAFVRGIAVDGRSQPQASMGIAVSDFDIDGDLDMYMTGFWR